MQLQEEENTMTMPDMGPTKEPMEDGRVIIIKSHLGTRRNEGEGRKLKE
jgi:hypothetical protein